MCFCGALLDTNIINTLSGSCFVDTMTVSLCLYLQAIYIKWLCGHMSGNKQSIRKWLSHVRQLGGVSEQSDILL